VGLKRKRRRGSSSPGGMKVEVREGSFLLEREGGMKRERQG